MRWQSVFFLATTARSFSRLGIKTAQRRMTSTKTVLAARWVERFVASSEDETTELVLIEKQEWKEWLESIGTVERRIVESSLPKGWSSGKFASVPDLTSGEVKFVACCCEGPLDTPDKAFEALATLATQLPGKRSYAMARPHGASREIEPYYATLGWSLGTYVFDRYKKSKGSNDDAPLLAWPNSLSESVKEELIAAMRATYTVRDLITTPAEDMGPKELAAALESLATQYPEATFSQVVGDTLIKEYPQLHAVGRGAAVGKEPRLARLQWGSASAETVYVIGKGVTFDTGGLNIKPGNAMLTMKKDMGGAAHAVALADMIMSAKLDLNLVVLLGCAENSISGPSFRPGDVLTARGGTTTEVLNTDAEGRLILADLLVDATESSPELILDFATLTGAGRVALGTEVPALFCNRDDLAHELQTLSTQVNDQVWRLPLVASYNRELESKVADLKNIGSGPYGGAITAALYLQKFIQPSASDDDSSQQEAPPWIHLDLMAYNPSSKPGRPEGGEAMGLRAVFELLKQRYPPQH